MKTILLIFFISAAYGGVINKGNWNGLQVTWNFDPLANNAYAKMPQEVSDCAKKNFLLKDEFCSATGNFVGYRYWQVNDPSVILIFDVNGYIAGIQTGVPKDQFTPSPVLQGHPYIDDGDYWTLTAYFVEPGIVCAPGRTSKQFNNEGNGYRFYIQNGTNPITDLIDISLSEKDLNNDPITGPQWGSEKCYWSMGKHYWYKLSPDMDCSTIFPFFILYNGGDLNAFGFFINTEATSSRYEQTDSSMLEKEMESVPECFYQDPNFKKVSSMHVYLTDAPLLDLC